jgi:hypothetical protein
MADEKFINKTDAMFIIWLDENYCPELKPIKDGCVAKESVVGTPMVSAMVENRIATKKKFKRHEKNFKLLESKQ